VTIWEAYVYRCVIPK